MRDVSHRVHFVQFLEDEIVGSTTLTYYHHRALIRTIANIEVSNINALDWRSDPKEALILGGHAYRASVSPLQLTTKQRQQS